MAPSGVSGQMDPRALQAIQEDRADDLRALLGRKSSIDAKDAQGFTLLHWAARTGSVDTVSVLLDRGACIDARNDRQGTPLYHAVLWERIDTVRLLLDRGANIEARHESGETPLLLAIGLENDSLAIALLDRGAHIEARDQQGNTPLHHAVRLECMGIAMALIDRGASLEARKHDGNTPLEVAIDNDRLDAARLLVACGVEPPEIGRSLDRSRSMGRILQLDPLRAAAELGNVTLLARVATSVEIQALDPRAQTRYFRAVARHARRYGHPESLAFLHSLQARRVIDGLSAATHRVQPL